MRRALPLAALTIALAVPPAALAKAPTNAQLQAEIKALQTKVTKQDKTIATLTNQVDQATGIGAAALVFGICGLAITSDAIQGTFAVVDQVAVNTPNVLHTYFGPQVPINDSGACDAIKVVRTQIVPPTTAGFSALFSLLRASSAAAAFDVLRG